VRAGLNASRLVKDGLINQTILCGARMHHHFSRVQRRASFRREGRGAEQAPDVINAQERIDQGYPEFRGEFWFSPARSHGRDRGFPEFR
jgi:hypothetical protein